MFIIALSCKGFFSKYTFGFIFGYKNSTIGVNNSINTYRGQIIVVEVYHVHTHIAFTVNIFKVITKGVSESDALHFVHDHLVNVRC